LHERLQPGYERLRLASRDSGKGAGEQIEGEHLAVPAQRAVPGRGQPDQRAPPVGRVALALEQPLLLQVADDLADDRLGPFQVRGRLADRLVVCSYRRYSPLGTHGLRFDRSRRTLLAVIFPITERLGG
jgi:hypothetical protein